MNLWANIASLMSPTAAVISWYQCNKRDLPWRFTRDPYSVWLSEVILQQTRVNQGLEYYHRFLELFPTVFDLAAASEDEVLKAWQGLGYYSRARNLHATAKKVVEIYEGVFPTTSTDLKQLKGVGDYTAAAIASFCFDECEPVLDGNVQRVVARLLAIEEPADKPSGKAIIMAALREWIDCKNPAIFNQAIMEFGALQCTPQNPRCEVCPLQADCRAFALKRTSEFPIKSGKVNVTDVWMYYFVLIHRGEVLVRQRVHSGIWKGLYDFPSIDSNKLMAMDEVLEHWCVERKVNEPMALRSAPTKLEHILSHRRVHATFIELVVSKKIEALESEKWIQLEDFDTLGVSRLVDRYIQEHSQLLGRME
jgi:A/G-specific adenine glycosylase